MEISIRAATADDHQDIQKLYPAAFPSEDLAPLVAALADEPSVLGMVVDADGRIAAHAMFSRCGTSPDDMAGALVGPVAVLPDAQRRGLGSGVIRQGLDRLARDGVRQAFVLGDPAYYGRLSFQTEASVLPPYSLATEWAAAWQSRTIANSPLSPGYLVLPQPWMDPTLWTV